MNWLQQIMKVGGPIKVTPDLVELADLVTDRLLEGIDENGEPLEYGGCIADKYLPIPYSGHRIIVVLQRPDQKQKEENIHGNAETPTWWQMNEQRRPTSELGSSSAGCHVNLYYELPIKAWRYDIRQVVLHEIIHCIDPKLNQEELLNTKWHEKHRQTMDRPGYQGSPEYYTAPWEQDAYISSTIYEMVQMWHRNGVSYNRAMEEIRSYPPQRTFEKEYAKNPQLWQRYMKHLYKVVQEVYQAEVVA